ncbi:MAG: DUF3794 domain-containing protein [Clostridiales bacterium]|nr:DUF3794 domain-containing protein [Clostridiales bacterium]
MTAELIKDSIKMLQMIEKDTVQVLLEEDILVPDIKPDLSKIVSIEGKMKILDKEISNNVKIEGKIDLKILYTPLAETDDFPLIPLDASINFNQELDYPFSEKMDVDIVGNVEHMDFEIINERKLRVKTVANITSKVYQASDKTLLSPLNDVEMQLLKKEAQYTDIVEKKKAPIDIKEELAIKEGMPEIGKILNWDVNIVENQKQITNNKIVINAAVQYNILYMSEEIDAVPVLFRENSEFTQFIDIKEVEGFSDSKVDFVLNHTNISTKKDSEENTTIFDAYVDITTQVEILKTKEKTIVVDAYHPLKEIEVQKDSLTCKLLDGKSTADMSVREILNIPDGLPDADRILQVTAKVFETGSMIEKERDIVEGILSVSILYLSNEEKKKVYGFNEEIPFRNAVEIAGLSAEKEIEREVLVKKVDFETINSKQIAISAEIIIKSAAYKKQNYEILTDVAILDEPINIEENPSIILYVTKKEDNLWKIAKMHRTTIEEIRTINNIEETAEVSPGEKLILIKNC